MKGNAGKNQEIMDKKYQTIKTLADQSLPIIHGGIVIAKDSASQSIRGAFFLNGSAAVAILAKQGGIGPDGGYVIILCALGAVFAVLYAGAAPVLKQATLG